MKFSLFQMDIIPGDPKANRERVQTWIENEMNKNHPDTIVLPEMWTTGYTLPELDQLADDHGNPTIPFLQQLANKFNVNIIGGSIANKKHDGIYNSAFAINRAGELIYEYDKVHLVPMLDEPSYLQGGNQAPEVFELDGLKFGLIICYDLRFPEIIRSLALDGAQVLCVVAEWPEARTAHWQHLQVARAIENQMYVVSSNRIGTYNNTEFAGCSMITDPWGDILAKASQDKEETIASSLDLEKVKEVRQNVPIFSSRVPHLYK
ncbi:carbon-nitrogen family hydrolase [Alkalibacillus aidingensis]|uniref:carbon-nitrogen family hydrolase n=1 Tax=Alkalibacillus aidingensis TaxID=2747607 RepID=UPI001661596F|nr:carbon-nitrogen family hydrolase [Alkalibacillus aidingensis]